MSESATNTVGSKRGRVPTERALESAEQLPASKRRKKSERDAQKQAKRLVTRFEKEIREMYSKDHLKPAAIAKVLRERHRLDTALLTANMVKSKISYDLKKGYITKVPVKSGETRVEPTAGDDWRARSQGFARERDGDFLDDDLDDDAVEDSGYNTTVQIFSESHRYCQYEDPQGKFMLVYITLFSGETLTPIEYSRALFSLQLFTPPPPEPAITLHRVPVEAVDFGEKTSVLSIVPPDSMEFDAQTPPKGYSVDRLTGKPITKSADENPARLVTFKIAFVRAAAAIPDELYNL